jgi:hypothetical protein
MASNTERSKVIIDLDSAKAEANLKKLERGMKSLRQRIKEATTPDQKNRLRDQLKESTAAAAKLKAQLRGKIQVIIDGNLAGKSIRDLEGAARKLRKELKNMNPDSKAFIKGSQAMRQIDGRIRTLNQTIRSSTGAWAGLKAQVKSFGVIAGSYLGFTAMAAGIGSVIRKNSELSDSLADIQKTTGLTEKEVVGLNNQLKKIDTRTSTAELREMAVVAGQLGIANKKVAEAEVLKRSGDIEGFNAMIKEAQTELFGFIEAVDRSNVALGDEFTGGAQEITTVLGRLRNVLGDIKSDNVGDDMLSIGNALNALGASGQATSPVMAEFATRIGAAGIPLGLTSGQVLGLSATLQELGVKTEAGSSSMIRILGEMTTNTAEFARVANMDVASFTKLVNEDLFGAFMKVLEGTKAGGDSATAFSGILKELGVDGVRTQVVMANLKENIGLLNEKVEFGTKTLKNHNSINDEFTIKNENLAAKISKLKKRFVDFVESPALKDFLKTQVVRIINFLDWLAKIPKVLKENRTAIVAVVTAFVAYRANLLAASIASKGLTTAILGQRVAMAASAKMTAISAVATRGLRIAKAVLAGKIKLATIAQNGWNRAVLANPVGLIIAGLVALVEVVDLYRKNTKEAIQLERDKKALGDQLVKVNGELKESLQSFNSQVERFNTLSPQQRKNIIDITKAKLEDAKATLSQLQADQLRVTDASSKVGTWEFVWNAMKSGGNGAALAMMNATDAVENGLDAGDQFNDQIKSISDTINGLSGTMNKAEDIQNAFSDAMKMETKTLSQYEEKLAKLQLALKNSVVGSEEYKKIMLEIAAVEAVISKETSAGGINTDEAVASLEKLRETLLSIEQDLENTKSGRYQKEINAIENKYDKLRELAVGNSAELIRISELEKEELGLLDQKFDEKILELRENRLSDDLSKDELELERIREKYQKQIEEFQGFSDKIKEIEAIRDDEMAEKRAEHREREQQSVQGLQDTLFDLTLTDSERKINAEADKFEQLIIQAEAYNAAALARGEDAIFDIESLIKLKNKRIQKLIKKGNAEEIAEELKRAEELIKIKRAVFSMVDSAMSIAASSGAEMAQYQKGLTLAKIAMDTASAISSLTAASEANPANAFTLGGAGIGQFITGLARILANIASAKKVLSEANAPKLEEGGFAPETNSQVMEGPSHQSGGIDLVHSGTGKKIGEAQGGEPILSISDYRANRALVDAIMASGGKSIVPQSGDRQRAIVSAKALEDGGFVPQYLDEPIPQLNSQQLAQTIRMEKHSAGEITDGGLASGISELISQLNDQKPVDDVTIQLMAAIVQLNQNLENPTPGKSFVVYQDIEKSKKKIETIRNNAGLG